MQELNFNDEIEKLIKNDKIYGILFDAGVPGSGKTFRWHRINGIKEKIKYSLRKINETNKKSIRYIIKNEYC